MQYIKRKSDDAVSSSLLRFIHQAMPDNRLLLNKAVRLLLGRLRNVSRWCQYWGWGVATPPDVVVGCRGGRGVSMEYCYIL